MRPCVRVPVVGEEADLYWKQQISDLKAEVDYFEHELEEMSVFRHKDIFHKDEVFDFMKRMMPHHKNAFLFNRKLT